MTMGSILTGFVFTAALVAFILFAVYFLTRQTASEGYTSPLMARISRELTAILGTLLILFTIIVLAIAGYTSVFYLLKG